MKFANPEEMAQWAKTYGVVSVQLYGDGGVKSVDFAMLPAIEGEQEDRKQAARAGVLKALDRLQK